jgi:hypothetical protein
MRYEKCSPAIGKEDLLHELHHLPYIHLDAD